MTQMTTKHKPRPLAQQLEAPDASRRLWIDKEAFPDPLLCSWCGASLALVDSDPAIKLRSVAFARAHSRCRLNACRVDERVS